MNVPAPRAVDAERRHHLLGVYLNDHLAAAGRAARLASRLAAEHGASAIGAELEDLAREIALDRQALLRVMAEVGVVPRPPRQLAAWPNLTPPGGLLRRRPGPGILAALEALRGALEPNAALWRTLGRLAPTEPRLDPARMQELRRRTERQLALLDTLHEQAVEEEFAAD